MYLGSALNDKIGAELPPIDDAATRDNLFDGVMYAID